MIKIVAMLAATLMTWPCLVFASETKASSLKKAVVSNYCCLMSAQYEDSLNLARRMQSSIESFVAKPTPEGMLAARTAWIQCRQIYIQTEVGRFYDGPIEAVEGLINAWPIDENYIDYTDSESDAGIINQTKKFPQITRDLIADNNEKGGEKNISTGFHAIEFLLWGQDFDENGAGKRSHLDFIESNEGCGRTALRRREYLRVVTSLLIEHLTGVESQWSSKQPGNYREQLLTMPSDFALANILKGVGSLSGAELSGERLLVPYTTKQQEDEHSCFSDTTHLDLINNQVGIQNICLGSFTRADGTRINGDGLLALIEKVNAPLAATLKRQLEESLAALKAIPLPFDRAILGRDTDAGRVAIKKAIDCLNAQTTSIAKAAKALDIRLNL
jgi:putative iron-regulated protein